MWQVILSSIQVKSFYFPATKVELRIQQKEKKKKKKVELRIIFWSSCPFISTVREKWTDFYLEYLSWIQLFADFISNLLTDVDVIRNQDSKSMACVHMTKSLAGPCNGIIGLEKGVGSLIPDFLSHKRLSGGYFFLSVLV